MVQRLPEGDSRGLPEGAPEFAGRPQSVLAYPVNRGIKQAMKLNFSFSVRGPDRVSEELATVLSKKGAWEFKSLFDMVHANLRSKDLVRGGEEMLRLRTYEKLQNFLQAGIVKKTGKEYAGVPKSLAAFFKTSEEFNARFASGTHCRPALISAAAKGATDTVAANDKKPAAAKAPVRKAQAGLARKAKSGRKATVQAR